MSSRSKGKSTKRGRAGKSQHASKPHKKAALQPQAYAHSAPTEGPQDDEMWSWYDPNAPLISMAMMVKNEEEFLEDALLSVRGIADELIVVDTGSSDRTVEIARELGAEVFHYQWRDDFSDARNETIRRSKGQWVLILDADERVKIKPEHISVLRNSLQRFLRDGPYVGISLQVVNVYLDGRVMNSLPSLRLFPRCEEISYRNRVHNQINLMNPEAEMTLKVCDFMTIEHLGYDPVVYEARKKSARSLPLIQKMCEDEPDNMVYRFYEGREFVILKQPEKAVSSLETAVLGILEGKHGYFVETMKTLLTAYEQVGAESERIILFTEMGIEKSPDQPDFYLFKGFAEFNIKRFDAAIGSLKEALKRWDNFVLTDVSQSNPIIEQRRWLAEYTLADMLWTAERYDEAYPHYLKAMETMPEQANQWRLSLNNTAALAIEYEDIDNLNKIFMKIMMRSDAQLDMFFFRVNQLKSHERVTEARDLLKWGTSKSSRIRRDPQFAPLETELLS